jgi:hypothetical protein
MGSSRLKSTPLLTTLAFVMLAILAVLIVLQGLLG